MHGQLPFALNRNGIIGAERHAAPRQSLFDVQLIENEKIALRRAENEMHLPFFVNRHPVDFAVRRTVNPCVHALRDVFRERDVGLLAVVQAGVVEQEEMTAVIGDIFILQQEPVRLRDGYGVRQ